MSYVEQSDSQIIIQGVLDPGSPNFERILLRVTGAMTLSGFGITVAQIADGRLYPFYDNCYWFPGITTKRPTLILLYSRRGTTEWGEYEGTPVLHLFWQRDLTMFSGEAPTIVPMMFRTDAVAGGEIIVNQ